MHVAELFAAINWWAVLVGLVANMAVGFVWYNPKTFFPTWWKVVGKTEQPGMENMNTTWVLTIVSAFFQALFMSLAVTAVGLFLGHTSALTGLATGGVIWLGFIAPTYLVNKLFAGHGLKIWAIEVANHLVDFLMLGALFGAWR